MATKEQKREWREQGFQMGVGVITAGCLVILFAALLSLGARLIGASGDDCDKSAWSVCGMQVRTDAKTGHQYLVTSGGGIVRREP